MLQKRGCLMFSLHKYKHKQDVNTRGRRMSCCVIMEGNWRRSHLWCWASIGGGYMNTSISGNAMSPIIENSLQHRWALIQTGPKRGVGMNDKVRLTFDICVLFFQCSNESYSFFYQLSSRRYTAVNLSPWHIAGRGFINAPSGKTLLLQSKSKPTWKCFQKEMWKQLLLTNRSWWRGRPKWWETCGSIEGKEVWDWHKAYCFIKGFKFEKRGDEKAQERSTL